MDDPDDYEKTVSTRPGTWLGGLEVQVSLGVGPRLESGFWPHPRHLRSHVRDSCHLSPALDVESGLALSPLVAVGGVSEPVSQLLYDVLLGALQTQSPVPGQEASVGCPGVAAGGVSSPPQILPSWGSEGHLQSPPAREGTRGHREG